MELIETMETSMILMSESDSSNDTILSMSKPKRKRQRLDHLSQEEKLMRRKLKNRMAAQSARDRKKVKMQDLEQEVTILEKQRNALLKQNESLKLKNILLEQQNKELLQRINSIEEKPSMKLEDNCPDVWCETFKSAVGTGLTTGQTDIAADVIDDAIRLLADNKSSDDLLDVLNIYSEELFESDTNDSNDIELETNDGLEYQQISTEQTSQLGSIKDLIPISDHLYLKTTALTTNPIDFLHSTNNNNNNNNNNNMKNNCPLSPFSINSDSGYESIGSPSLSLADQLIGSSDVCLEESFTELFPDLV